MPCIGGAAETATVAAVFAQPSWCQTLIDGFGIPGQSRYAEMLHPGHLSVPPAGASAG